MIKFHIIPIGDKEFPSSCVLLRAKGKGIGDGISWNFIGEFSTRKYCYLMMKALRNYLKEKKNV